MTQASIKTRATYSWGGNTKKKELGFMEGDVIEVLQVINKDIYYGESHRTKMKGFFPSKYVECDLSPDRSRSSTPTYEGSISPSSSKNTSSNSLFTLKKNDKSFSSTLTSELPALRNKEQALAIPEARQSKKFSSSYVQQLLDASTISTDTNSSSVFGHSDFSATSAGSYMGHSRRDEYDHKLQSMMNSNSNYNDQTRKALNEIIEKHEKKKQPKLLGKFFGNKGDDGPSFDDKLYLSTVEKMSQISFKEDFIPLQTSEKLNPTHNTQLERTRTLSGHSRGQRYKRILKEQPELILKPQKSITNVNYEARDPTFVRNYNIDSIDFSRVDKFVHHVEYDPYETIQKFTKSVILKHFESEVEISRAIYVYLINNFKLVNKKNEKVSTKKMFESEKISEIMHSTICTPHQLTWMYYIMAETAGLDVKMILGYLKFPFVLNETVTDSKKRLIINHSWISIQIEGEYRFVDVALGNPTNEFATKYPDIWDPISTSNFYHLTRPFHLVYTHSPRYIEQQYIVPPIDVVSQLSLPPLYPHAIIAGVKLHKFSYGLLHLRDHELYEFELEIPEEYLVKGEFKPYDQSFECCDSLVQIYHYNGRRIARFQGIMSKNCPAGFISVTGKHEFTKEWNILMSVPCFHVGKWAALNWVKTVPGLNGVDVYIKEPKIKDLELKEQTFNIVVNSKTEYFNQVKRFFAGSFKVGLFPPNKQIIELDITDNNSYIGNVNVNVPGNWRLGILDVNMKRWKVIAEWEARPN